MLCDFSPTGVVESVTKLFGRAFVPFADFVAIKDDVMFARRTVDPDGAEGKVVEAHMRPLAWCRHALFLEVMVEKADQRSTFLLPQCGHKTSPSSQSTRDRTFEK
jgi:hypothetical protein